LIRSKSNKFRPFVPDFSLRVSEDVQILRIRRVHWLAAVRATFFEKKQTANDESIVFDTANERIDLLKQELDKVDQIDLSNVPNTNDECRWRARTSSLALTITSDHALEHGKLLGQHQTMSTLSNSMNFSADTPYYSGRNTPTLPVTRGQRTLRSQETSPVLSTSSLSTHDGLASHSRSLT
jgi:hypothetical protein